MFASDQSPIYRPRLTPISRACPPLGCLPDFEIAALCRKRSGYSGQNVDLAPHRGGCRVFLETRDTQRFSLLVDDMQLPITMTSNFLLCSDRLGLLNRFVRVQTEGQTVLNG